MKEIALSQGKVALVDDEDFEFLNQRKWYAAKQKRNFYAVRNVYVKSKWVETILMHREVLRLSNKLKFADHVDFNGLNNQKYNLRVATKRQNNSHLRPRPNSSSIYLGVSLSKNTTNKVWKAQIKTKGKVGYLGHYENEIDAAIAYNKAAQNIHGEFANLNVI